MRAWWRGPPWQRAAKQRSKQPRSPATCDAMAARASGTTCSSCTSSNVLTMSREIATGPHVAAREGTAVQVVGFPGRYPNHYAERVLTALCTHPNVGGCLLVSLGCESFDRQALSKAVRLSGRWVESLVIQREGGTVLTVARGRDLVEKGLEEIAEVERTPMAASELVVGTICGGSDSTSTLTANPGVGRAFDRLVAAGARCISRRQASSSAARSTSAKGRRRRS